MALDLPYHSTKMPDNTTHNYRQLECDQNILMPTSGTDFIAAIMFCFHFYSVDTTVSN